MSDPKRTAERNAGAFLSPTDISGGMIPTPMNSLTVGPGQPGPEDEWKIPLGPIDELTRKDDAVPEPVPVAHGASLLHRLTHRG